MPDRILLFIPAYNCAAQIGRVLAQVQGEAASLIEQVLVLDNGSTDGTREAAVAAMAAVHGPAVTVGGNRANYNLGGSHKVAFAYARDRGFSHVAVLHGDDQGTLADLLPVIRSGRHRKLDACLGSRFARGAKLVNYSAFRIMGNRVFNLLFSAGSGRWVTDLGSGLNLFGRRVVDDPHVLRWSDDLRFNIFLLLGMHRQGMDIAYFPISWREEDQISNVKMTSQALKSLAILRDYVLRPRHFMAADHRATAHDSYAFDVVAERRAGGA